MSVSDIVFVVLLVAFFVVCVIGAVTGLTPGEMIDAITPIRRR